MIKRKKEKNLLTMIPKLADKVNLESTSSGDFLIVHRTSWAERLSIRLFRQPRIRKIKLDQFGHFVIDQIDGKRDVEEIAHLIEIKFGEEAAPFIPRLMKFLQILDAQEWIEWVPDR